jgi:replication factor A1
MSEEIAPIIEEIKEALPDVDTDEITKELDRYLKYGIVPQEAKKAILKKFGGSQQSFSSLGEKKLSELKGNEMNVDVTVKCLSSNERIQKTVNGDKTLVTGLVADDSMIRRFVSWEGHLLEKGNAYSIKGVSAKTFRGEVELNLGQYTKVEDAPDDALSDLEVSKLPRFGNLVEVPLKDVKSNQGNILVKGKILSVEKRSINTERGSKTIFDGILADTTKRVRFTSWHDFSLETGDVVSVKGAYVKEWRGIPQINFDDRAEVEKVEDHDFDVMKTPRLLAEELLEAGASDVEVLGTIIEIRDGSGLIFRCPSCNRALIGGNCSVHGQQEGLPDLRTKVVLDDGTGALFAILNTEITEQILGMGVTECESRYCDDEARVVDHLNEKLLGKEFIMRGNVIRDDFGPTVLPNVVEPGEEEYMDEAKALIDVLEVL